MPHRKSILNGDKRVSNRKVELNFADLDAVSGGGASKAQSDVSQKWSQTLDSIVRNLK